MGIALIFAETVTKTGGGFKNWWIQNADPYLNYPGFEAWKFINLAIFVAVMVYLLKKPLTDVFKTKRETIRAELVKAEEERQAALAKLTSAEANLARVSAQSDEIVEKARAEAAAEKTRIEQESEKVVNSLQTKIDEVQIVARDGDRRMWSYAIRGRDAATGVAGLPTPLLPIDEGDRVRVKVKEAHQLPQQESGT